MCKTVCLNIFLHLKRLVCSDLGTTKLTNKNTGGDQNQSWREAEDVSLALFASADLSSFSFCRRLMRQESVNRSRSKNKPVFKYKKRRACSRVRLGGVAFDLSLWGEEGLYSSVLEGCAWHMRSALSSSQEINLFERAAGLKIGKPQNNSAGINCPVFARRREDSGEEERAPVSMCASISLVRLLCYFDFVAFFRALTAFKVDLDLNLSLSLSSLLSLSLLATCQAVLPAAIFDRMWRFITAAPQ